MPLERLKVDGVRCLEALDCRFDPDWNLLVGANGAGKTSILESIHLLGRRRSFRTRQTRRLVRHGQGGFTVHGTVAAGGRVHGIGAAFADGALEIRVDGAPCRGMAELAELLPVHVLDPNLHQLIEAAPSIRRRSLDAAVFHVEHRYLEIWRAYRRALGQRNAALKDGHDRRLLDAWGRSFIDAADAIDGARQRYVDRLAPAAATLGERLLGEPLTIGYRRGWRQGIDLGAALAESEARDRAAGFTQPGPHRADLRIGLGGGRARDEASRGEQKLMGAAYVLGQLAVFHDVTGRAGVLLVDDAAAELDARSLARLLEALVDAPAQRILTALSADAIALPRGATFHVEQGRVEAVV